MFRRLFKIKKGVSPLIATVLLIAFSVALGAVVMSWGRSFITSQTESVEGESSKQMRCSLDILLDWVEINGYDQVCFINNTGTNATLRMIVDNIGNEEIIGIKVQLVEADGDVSNYDDNTKVSSGFAQKYEFNLGARSDFSGISFASLIPKIKIPGSSQGVLCSNNNLDIEEVFECE
ncbi:hypothetical protein JXB41_03120 [Candidatus Woesearchaeota archaeon]|nr:hypothetical protein [Candidatus Woesearchaeota archaeon]